MILPKEQIFSKYNGVWNLSAEQGNLGTFYFTNVRVIWFAQLAENFNVSLPWVQVKCIKVRDSKYGTALVLETSEFSGAYILGFRVENVEEVYQEATNLFKTYSQNPMFGVEVSFEDADTNIASVTIPQVEDNLEIIDTGYSSLALPTSKTNYSMGSEASADVSQIMFSQEMGLAFERPRNGATLD